MSGSYVGWAARFGALVVAGFLALERVDTTALCGALAAAVRAVLATAGVATWRQGIAVHGDGFAMQVAAACDGTDVCLLLGAAILATAVPWQRRLVGLAAALALTELVNVARLATLFVVGAHFPQLFEAAHHVLWQVAMMLWAVGFYLRWH